LVAPQIPYVTVEYDSDQKELYFQLVSKDPSEAGYRDQFYCRSNDCELSDGYLFFFLQKNKTKNLFLILEYRSLLPTSNHL